MRRTLVLPAGNSTKKLLFCADDSQPLVSYLQIEQVNLLQKEEQGKIIDPYKSLPEIIVGLKTSVKDGTGAIRAYQDMLYGLHKNDQAIKSQWEISLKQYCRLDTLAMLIIWEYWRSKFVSGE